jgi:hypothetical protein
MSPCIDDIRSALADSGITALSVLEDDGVDLLSRALAEADERQFLVLYDSCTIAVARSLAAGQIPSNSLATWKRRANALLTAHRLNCNRIVFASAAEVEADPREFLNALTQYFMLPAPLGAMGQPPVVAACSALQLLIASQALAADAEAVFLDRQLASAALRLPPVTYDVDEAFTELKAEESIRALLLRQIHDVQSELREHFLTATASKAESATVVRKAKQVGDANHTVSGKNSGDTLAIQKISVPGSPSRKTPAEVEREIPAQQTAAKKAPAPGFAAAPQVSPVVGLGASDSIKIEFDPSVVQTGFYQAEQGKDGRWFRWIGPEPKASVLLPMVEGPLSVVLKVVATFAKNALEKTRISLDAGRWVECEISSEPGAHLLTAIPPRGHSFESSVMQIDIDCGLTESPADYGKYDTRRLGVAIHSLELRRLKSEQG